MRRTGTNDARGALQSELTAVTASHHALKERILIELDYKIGATYLRMERPDDAGCRFTCAWKGFTERGERGADDPFTKDYIAGLCALRGEHERAIRYFAETLGQRRALNLARARMDPNLDSIRDNPEFAALVSDQTPGPPPASVGQAATVQPGVVS